MLSSLKVRDEMSEREIALLRAIGGYEEFLDCTLSVPNIYEMMARDCFIANRQGPAIDSLRRCLKALGDGKPYRRTPEFEAMIVLE